jgi:2-oxoisovalerate dehydrogenase E1 component
MTNVRLLAEPPDRTVDGLDVDPVGIDLIGKALLIRGVEKRLLQLFAQGKLFGTVHTCIGQEWTGIAVAEALQEGDLVFSNHRCHGHYVARTGDVEGLVAEIMGKATGICGGRGGSQHICAPGFFSNGIQGGIVPVAAGLAMAQKLRRRGNIAVVFIGDGTLGEGIVYETMNLTAKWELPLLMVLENNLYAQSTSQQQTLAGNIRARAEAFGITTAHCDTWGLAQLLEETANAVSRVRLTGQPMFLQIDTYRLMAHSKGDDVRDPAEVNEYAERDPLTQFERRRPREAARIQAEVERRIDAAVQQAGAAPFEVASESEKTSAEPSPLTWLSTSVPKPERCVHQLHAGLQRNLRRDERILLIGEDIEGPYGGAFKATKQLSQEFPGRVRNTPISEAAIVGLANGLALAGFTPVCEIMFGDFLTLAFDQLVNHAAKFRYMYNGQVRVPLVVRTPMGGKRGYGPTHSQSLEKHFLGVPDTLVLALHSRWDPGLVYDRLFETIDRPTLVIENKLLYGARISDEVSEGFVLEHTDEAFPTTRVRPLAVPDVTILCYGGMLPDVEDAANVLFDEHDIISEIICPLRLYPLDLRPVVESLHKTGRLLVVEEGQGFAAFGAEVTAQVAETALGDLKRVARLSAPAHPVPSSGPLEKALLPGSAHIVQAVIGLLRHE